MVMFEIEAVNVKTSQGRLEEKLQRNHKKELSNTSNFSKNLLKIYLSGKYRELSSMMNFQTIR